MDTEYVWNDLDLATLRELEAADAALPADSPRALLSVRLSVFTDDTTSPVRQELDLRRLALDKGYRVAGVASDLGVSATKVPPWKRKNLGDWLNNRAPEFDVLLFWKLDRFIRSLSDLAVMIRWAEDYHKNLVSKNDPIDLSTTMGKIMVTFIGGVAEIESANTKTRVESLWSYAKTQTEWLVGNPPYGYTTEKVDGKRQLAINEEQADLLRLGRDRLLAGDSMSQICRDLKETGKWGSANVATLGRRLRNPGILGYRVEERKGAGYRRSQLVLDEQGQPITVGPAIFTQEEFDVIQAELDKRERKQPMRHPGGGTRFLGVLICADCESHMTVQTFTKKPGDGSRVKEPKTYSYLRCQKCKTGGMGAPNPQVIFDQLVKAALDVIGEYRVETREYARGEESRKQVKELQDRIEYYMKGLEPGGRLTKSAFSRQQAESALDAAIAELESIDPTTTEDRWIYVDKGLTFREHWEQGGMEAMEEDLLRAGIRCVVTRTKVPRQRAPRVDLSLRIPADVQKRLIVKRDEFANPV